MPLLRHLACFMKSGPSCYIEEQVFPSQNNLPLSALRNSTLKMLLSAGHIVALTFRYDFLGTRYSNYV